jgi:hypothetical protein
MLHGAADGRGSSSSFDYLTPNEFVARATKTSTASPALIRVPTAHTAYAGGLEINPSQEAFLRHWRQQT